MNIKISESIITKIRNAEYGEAVLAMLLSFCDRQNTAYNRGIVHGYLLMLTTIEVLSNEDALELLEQIER